MTVSNVQLELIDKAKKYLKWKPIIDINISVESLEPMEPYKVPLEKLGYTFIVDPDPIDLHFFAKPFSHPRSYHIHVCTIGSWHEISDLAFRDFLINNPDEAINYGKLPM